jgi:hypothetical protein
MTKKHAESPFTAVSASSTMRRKKTITYGSSKKRTRKDQWIA